MSRERMPREQRKNQLLLAILRIERSRARTTQEVLPSVASVAREAGVSTALIHTYFPEVAESIREKGGRSSRAQRDAKHAELKVAQEKIRELQATIDENRVDKAKLASINEVLAIENSDLRARLGAKNVTDLEPRTGQ